MTAPEETDYEAFEALKQSFRCQRCYAEPGVPCVEVRSRKKAQWTHSSRNDQAWLLIQQQANPPTDLQRFRAKRLAEEWQ